MTWKIFWTGAAAVAAILLPLVLVASTCTFLYRHPRLSNVRVVIDRRTGAAVVAALASPESGIKLTNPEPQAFVESRNFDFGLMDPGISGRHDFVIQNRGNDVLELQVEGTTCKCTISGVSDNRILPGKSATMTMEWNTGKYNPKFTQSAVIRTNDPINRTLEFTIAGQVRGLLIAEPSVVNLPLVKPDERGVGEVLLYSQMWKDFEVINATSQLPDLQWSVVPAGDLSQEFSALSAKRIRFDFQSPQVPGGFNEKVRIDIRSADEPNSIHHEYVDLIGKSMRRLAWYGPAIGENGVIELGNLTEGQGKRITLLAKVRDEEPDVGDVQLKVYPEFLRAEFTPYPGEKKGLYSLTIEVPDNVQPCQFNSDPIGNIRIETKHPRIGSIDLHLTFAVVPRRGI